MVINRLNHLSEEGIDGEGECSETTSLLSYTLRYVSFSALDGPVTRTVNRDTGMEMPGPVVLSQTCYGSKSLKVILMDSNFGGHPVLKPLVTL